MAQLAAKFGAAGGPRQDPVAEGGSGGPAEKKPHAPAEGVAEAAGAAAGAAVAAQAELGYLQQLRALSRLRPTRAQANVILLAFSRFNLLMRGPPNSGKRWIARHAASLLSLERPHSPHDPHDPPGGAFSSGGRGDPAERVESLCKWFTINAQGQIIIDDAMTSSGTEQIRRATVLIVENVPSHPVSAAAFFAHLDFVARMIRSQPIGRDSDAQAYVLHRGRSSTLPFGGIQIIATQNESEEERALSHGQPTPGPQTQVLWSPHAAPVAPVASAEAEAKGPTPARAPGRAGGAGGAGPGAPIARPEEAGGAAQFGLVLTGMGAVASHPHPDVHVVLLR
jgi:hypothetical protein